ncbi:glycogen synthase GlgA [Candidatus Margulisiibacteriota bacterium]
MKILFASAEVVPFAKTGGLADVAGALPKGLSELGHEVRIIMPRYKMIDPKKFKLRKILSGLQVKILDRFELADIYSAKIPGSDVTVYFVANQKYFDRDGLYQDKGKDHPDNCERFSFYCKAVMEFIDRIGWHPDVLHCNDWQTALMIPYAKLVYKWASKTIYSIHNLAYTGSFPKEQLPITGFGDEMYTPGLLEYWGKFALTKAGFVFADKINTVSPTYASEIQTNEFGCGMEGLLQSRSSDISGILNGIDYSVWDPATDKKIVQTFSPDALDDKIVNKLDLQKENKIAKSKTVPLIGIISRLADQKGFDLLAGALEDIMALKCQIVVLGTGDPKYHKMLEEEKKKYPKQLGINLGFDAALAQKIYAGSDMFLMPSRYEPCGLGQLISFKYGTIPIVRKTGGLADTVHQFDPKSGAGDGFVFEEATSEAFFEAVKTAVSIFRRRKKAWRGLVEKVMLYDYSWETSAKKYVELYNSSSSNSKNSIKDIPLYKFGETTV